MIKTKSNPKECELLPHNSDLHFLGGGGKNFSQGVKLKAPKWRVLRMQIKYYGSYKHLEHRKHPEDDLPFENVRFLVLTF